MSGNIFMDVHAPEDCAVGKDGGSQELAEMKDFKKCVVAEYVWLDSNGETRSKCKTLSARPESADDVSIWQYNGTPCGQAETKNSDVYLVPRKTFDDPVRGFPHVLVICESITSSMEPAEGNFRAECADVMEKFASCEPWFGMEQEYVICDDQGVALPTGKQDACYCGRGTLNLPKNMRNIMGEHYAMCLRAGIKISGMNCEAGMSQAEFQIGPCKAINIGDHVIAARHTLHKVANKYRCAISLKATNEGVDFGSGAQMNFSCKQTRGDGGLQVIEKIGRALGRRAMEARNYYGTGNEGRMRATGMADGDGMDNLSPQDEPFRFGVADRTASLRIPRQCGIVGKGWIEDRRPAANADPYRVSMHIMKTAGEVLAQMANSLTGN